MNSLTDRRIFEPVYLCVDCGLDLTQYDEATPPRLRDDGQPCTHPDFQEANTRRFLPGAATAQDVTARRIPGTPGQRGNALVDLEQRFVVHSPDGFEWGYGGSGPADFALNVLALFVVPPEAWRLHQDFKREFIAALPHDGGVIRAADVRSWIEAQWAA